MGARIQVGGKVPEATAHDFGQQVITAGVVLVGRLVRHPELARHVAQAEVLDAAFGNHLLRRHDAGLAQFQRGCRRRPWAGHEVFRCDGIPAEATTGAGVEWATAAVS